MYHLRRHFPTISAQIVKGKHDSAYYQDKPIWKDHFRRLMRLFQTMSLN